MTILFYIGNDGFFNMTRTMQQRGILLKISSD